MLSRWKLSCAFNSWYLLYKYSLAFKSMGLKLNLPSRSTFIFIWATFSLTCLVKSSEIWNCNHWRRAYKIREWKCDLVQFTGNEQNSMVELMECIHGKRTGIWYGYLVLDVMKSVGGFPDDYLPPREVLFYQRVFQGRIIAVYLHWEGL